MSVFEISKSPTNFHDNCVAKAILSKTYLYPRNILSKQFAKKKLWKLFWCVYFDVSEICFVYFGSMARALLIKTNKPTSLRLAYAKHLILYFKVALNPLNLLMYKFFLKSYILTKGWIQWLFLAANVIEQTCVLDLANIYGGVLSFNFIWRGFILALPPFRNFSSS